MDELLSERALTTDHIDATMEFDLYTSGCPPALSTLAIELLIDMDELLAERTFTTDHIDATMEFDLYTSGCPNVWPTNVFLP